MWGVSVADGAGGRAGRGAAHSRRSSEHGKQGVAMCDVCERGQRATAAGGSWSCACVNVCINMCVLVDLTCVGYG